MIVPLPTSWGRLRPSAPARLALEPRPPPGRLIVSPREGEQTARALHRYAPFYGLGEWLLLTTEPLGLSQRAGRWGGRCCRLTCACCCPPSVLPQAAWPCLDRRARRARRRSGEPTLLYEDDSVVAAAMRRSTRYHGYSHHWLDDEGSRPSPPAPAVARPRGDIHDAGILPRVVLRRSAQPGFRAAPQAAGGAVHWLPGLRMSIVLMKSHADHRRVYGAASCASSSSTASRHQQALNRCLVPCRTKAEFPLLRVLMLSHGHPAFSIGGAEVASYNLFNGLNELEGIDCHYLARVGPPIRPHSGTPFLSLRQRERRTRSLTTITIFGCRTAISIAC